MALRFKIGSNSGFWIKCKRKKSCINQMYIFLVCIYNTKSVLVLILSFYLKQQLPFPLYALSTSKVYKWMLSSHLLFIFHAPQGPCSVSRTVFWLPIYLVSISVLHIIGNVPCFMITYEKCQEEQKWKSDSSCIYFVIAKSCFFFCHLS